MKLISVVLSGGAGTRLWPASRQAYPKPFMKLGGSALLEQAITRGQACGTDDLLIVTNQDHLFLTQGLLSDMADPPRVRYLLEPKGRNTAPAIALAALDCQAAHGDDAVMLVLPADHLIPDTEAFVANALEAVRQAQKGRLVVFGIQPTSPETGFGYIEVAKLGRDVQPVLKFVEKPDLATAQEYLATGRFYWNSGMFCFTAGAMLAALAQHAPDVLQAAGKALAQSTSQAMSLPDEPNPPHVTRFHAHSFGLQPDISIDYAVMERADNVTLVPARFGWSDVGAWPAVAQAHTPDASGNTLGAADGADWVAVNTTGTHVHVDSHCHKVVATVGVQDLVVVDTPDALLVTTKREAQNVKRVVDALKERHINSPHHQSTLLPPAVHRPWGTYATLKEEDGYKVKRITVKPGQSLSLQYHHQRAEHWMLVHGRGIVQIGDTEHPTLPGQYHYIPLKEKHRLTNTGPDELVLIEVQCGDYLGEDDIVRLADTYGRS
ncbi:mannose-1-phosphate guanylyltransferase/mannose-6-phosphate isomerase [Hydrogenophaga taeniospiralis CCUG 15921]|uniref:mannose-1-phosphate guanylyltransferase n=1 Tax=Hydrogenophaga taeniospiralis CCUG 15921 TaxID=1281780 RepID=A0A9X4S945_9BURK|nr:mannose-1-phosphate guanylyltransferase/mannose-6-phosphate isomerase [Hydrogenophaga taeniospiralis]MDG5977192.1 mannose-1-phosphate guanylyltransferase/mannose-6-phosphate isomerase [Hydrogenophaga taeniospiralis CCUG 15921]